MKSYLFLFVITFISIANVYSQTGKIETFFVKDRQVNCEAVVPQKCLQVRREKQSDYRLFYDRIENFEFIAGYQYELRVEVFKIAAPPKDTSGFRYVLREIVKRTPVVGDGDQTENLVNRQWVLKFMNGEKVGSEIPHVRFDYGQNKFSGFSGCNNFFGRYSIKGASIGFSNIVISRKACRKDNPEPAFMTNFRKVDQYKVSADSLELYANGVVVLHFEPKK